MSRIRVAIVYGDVDGAKPIANLISDEHDLFVIGSATTEAEAVHLVQCMSVDIVLIDTQLDEDKLGGLHAANEIRQVTDAQIIILSEVQDERWSLMHLW